MDLMSELGDRVMSIEEMLDDLNDYVESIDDDLALLEGGHEGGAGFMDDGDDDFMDEMDEGEDQLHLLGGNAAPEEEAQTLSGAICPECEKMFFVDAADPEDAEYDCPHCGKRISPDPLTPENAPIAKPKGK